VNFLSMSGAGLAIPGKNSVTVGRQPADNKTTSTKDSKLHTKK
jgi:hypothetical protein